VSGGVCEVSCDDGDLGIGGKRGVTGDLPDYEGAKERVECEEGGREPFCVLGVV